ncbi:hypothetical protein CcI49_37115 [Frankia sp. CcI49]|nr:hypothetical protein CcI49_37115 [Frankia sp. CcI49]
MVTVIVGTVVGLAFLFGLGNVATLGIRFGVPTYVAILVAPAVDLSRSSSRGAPEAGRYGLRGGVSSGPIAQTGGAQSGSPGP